MHRTYIADIERGVRNVTLRSIRQLATALQVPVETLFARASEIGGDTPDAVAVSEILLVEDNMEDAELALRAFERANFANPIRVFADGAEVLDYLFSTGRYAGARSQPRPQLMLLDLNLPKIPGIEVLRRVKNDARTRNLPVVVLTVSREDRDIIECGQLGAANYIIKPVSFDSLCKVAPKLSFRWAMLKPRLVRNNGRAS